MGVAIVESTHKRAPDPFTIFATSAISTQENVGLAGVSIQTSFVSHGRINFFKLVVSSGSNKSTDIPH